MLLTLGLRGVAMLGHSGDVGAYGEGCAGTPAGQLSRAARPENASLQSGLSLAISGEWPALPLPDAGLKIQLAAKRLIDVILSLGALVILAPFLMLVAAAVWWTSPGGVFFRQKREGIDGRLFDILKFRSMYACGDAAEPGPRITPVGRAMRRASIDELPQLLNVLKGDMSLVGPRPHVPDMLAGGQRYDQLVPYYHARHRRMRPGISGWAQANGLRGSVDDPQLARKRIDHDLAYIQNFSLWLDVRIIAMTLAREFLRGSGD